ncbi:MAG: M48 family metallopeptidase [Snowella sp.]|nr:M48 family metallopeptidase [Snowella sp.]
MGLSPTVLIGLKADEFRHPLDREATTALKQLPGLDLAVRSLLGSVAEQFFALNNLAASVRVSEKQLPDLHDLLIDACRILDLEPPELYLQQHPVPNAYTFAMRGKKPFIVVHTSLIDMLTPKEIQAVLAHELGHLKCEHGVYLTLANIMVLAAGLLPSWGSVLAQSLQGQMLEWVRCAEFSCDRAALLAVQDPTVVMSVLMKLAGGSPQIAPKLNLEAFIEQARDYEMLSDNEMGAALKSMQTEQLTHPVPVLRAKEIDRWATTQAYQDLLKGRRGDLTSTVKEPEKGGWRNW